MGELPVWYNLLAGVCALLTSGPRSHGRNIVLREVRVVVAQAQGAHVATTCRN
jgi:hypothetical protein